MPQLKKGEVDLGTSIMAVKFDGGVVVGADSRTSTGIYVANRVSDKLTPLHDRIFCCRSGSAADTQAVTDMVRLQLEQHAIELSRPPSVKTAAALVQRVCYEYKDQLMAGIICAGYDEVKGDGSVYNIPLGGACVEQAYSIGGSGSTYIYGFCDAYYKPGMKEEECRDFVKKAADTQAVTDMVRLQLEQHAIELSRPPSVKTAAALVQRVCYEYKDQLMAGIICAGYDEVKGDGSVYNIPLGGACVEQAYSIGGSGSTYIYGFCDAYYKPGMKEEECRDFVKKSTFAAMARDGSSGGVIRTVTITKKGAVRDFTSGSDLPFQAYNTL
eukprot:CAMPEP_0204843338 /NCGR_PEP_ID=MMETSP1346-20131115/47918_1 /ASSEMBLY_ACC=CAM_ASM_000771 /TAXON_ID=215587 /ORGANISM="Aplanochytrium stocchinoi, Strain GSBS06" /LENGTH=326 /DNA_ID=CAMNT_0051982459 /DNA_START=205 /DNA_END=1186 /DNA_ORIENTATION=-